MEVAPKNKSTSQQGGYQPVYPPPGYSPQPYPAPQRNIGDPLKNPLYLAVAIGISIFLIWLGLLFQSLMIGTTDENTMKTYMQIGMIIYNLGMAGLVITLLFIGLGRHDYPQWVRVALIFGAILLIIWGFINILNLLGMIFRTVGSGGLLVPA